MRQQITKAAPVVKALLGLLGVPAGLVSAVELAGEVAGFTPGQAAVVRTFAGRAADSLEQHCTHEFLEVGDADKQALVSQLDEALGRCQRDGSLLIAGVEGAAQVRTLLVDEPVSRFLAQWDRWADQRGFFDGLLGNVSLLCQAWVRDPDVAQLATLESVAAVLQRIQSLSAKIDRLPAETAAAVRGVLTGFAPAAPQLIEVGAAPPIPAGFQPRPQDRDRLDAAWHRSPGPSTVPRGLVQLLTGDGGVGKTQLAGQVFRSSDAKVKAWIPATSLDSIISLDLSSSGLKSL